MNKESEKVYLGVGALLEERGQFILIRRPGSGFEELTKWGYPLGWLEAGEDPVEAVKEVVKQEIGLAFKPTHLLGVFSLVRDQADQSAGSVAHTVKMIFTGEHPDIGSNTLPSDLEMGWFNVRDLEEVNGDDLQDADLPQMANRHLSLKRFPLNVLCHTCFSDRP